MELNGYSRPTCNKVYASGHDGLTVIGVIHKLDRRRVLLTIPCLQQLLVVGLCLGQTR